MDAKTRARLRARLESLRDELLEQGTMAIPPARTDAVAQPDEDEAPLTEMTQAIASNRNKERSDRLDQIRDALELLAEDPEEFGLCEDCEEPIEPKRLELMPWVTLCVGCQDKRERDDRAPGTRKNLRDYR